MTTISDVDGGLAEATPDPTDPQNPAPGKRAG
jgi:hypothetical protein